MAVLFYDVIAKSYKRLYKKRKVIKTYKRLYTENRDIKREYIP